MSVILTSDVIELARRYHHVLLDHLVMTTPNPSQADIRATFRLYEEKVRDIATNSISDKELEYLKSLPNTREWKNQKPSPEKIWESGYFKQTKSVDAEVKEIIEQFVSQLSEKEQQHARGSCESLWSSYKAIYAEEQAIKMLRNILLS